MSQGNNVQNKSNLKVVVIGLAIICIILAGSLVGVIAIYQPNNSQAQLAEKDSTISSLQAQIASLEQRVANQANASTYVTQIAYLNQQLLNLNETLTNTNADLSSLQNILQLQASGTLYDDTFVQDANSSTAVWNDILEYSGYVVVQATATANTTYAQALYTFSGANFNFNQTIGTSGTAIFPVLPGTVEINIGNTNQTTTNTVTATATYYY
jgi:hypothetical protein